MFVIRALSAAVFAASALSGAAAAQACGDDPAFAAETTANRSVRAAAVRVERGDWDQAIHFGNEALERGGSSIHEAAAIVNLCAAYAGAGREEPAARACDAGVEAASDNWKAFNNRGAAKLLAGDRAGAAADFAQAAELGGGDVVAANQSLLNCPA